MSATPPLPAVCSEDVLARIYCHRASSFHFQHFFDFHLAICLRGFFKTRQKASPASHCSSNGTILGALHHFTVLIANSISANFLFFSREFFFLTPAPVSKKPAAGIAAKA